MKPLETEDPYWIHDLADCVRNLNSLMEAMDRELSEWEMRRGGNARNRIWGEDPSWSEEVYERNARQYRGHIENRFTRYVSEWHGRSMHVLDTYKKKMGVF